MAIHSRYFCLRNSMNRGAWRAMVPGVAKSQIWLRRHVCGKAHWCFWLLTWPILQEGKLAKRLLLYHFSELTLEEWKECFPLWFFKSILPHTDMSPPMWHRAHVSSSEPLHRKLVCVLVAQSCLTLCNSWTVVHQAPLFMEFFRQEYWVGCHALLQDRKRDKINTLTSLLCTPPLKLMPGSDRWGQAACLQPCQISLFLCPLSFSSLASLLSSLYRHH